MGVPKKRKSYTKRHMRRAHHALKKANIVKCEECGEPTLPHRICPNCNMYRGKRILPLED